VSIVLDYVPATQSYILRVPRGQGDAAAIMEEHGFDWSNPDSTPEEAVLFTREPFAAVGWYDYATPQAKESLERLRGLMETSWAKESTAHIECPADQQLAPFQIAGVDYARGRLNTLIGDAPGLGKTPEAICLANEMQAERILVLCPANIRLQWVAKIREWTTMRWPYLIHPILIGKHGVHPNAHWTVVSYDLARTPAIGKALARGKYDLLILDEAHYLKTIDTHRTRAVFGGGLEHPFDPLAERCERIVGLTGTPLPNRPREAYTLARGLCFDAIDWMSEERFRERFNPSRKIERTDANGRTKVFIDERAGRHGELQARLRSNFMVRREKHGPEGVGYQLRIAHVPSLDIVRVEETAAIREALAAERLLDIDPEGWEGADASFGGEIATVRRLMGVAVAPQAAEYIEMCLNGGEDKIVVFAHHREVLNILQEKLARFGVLRIDGSTSVPRRQAITNEFVANPSFKVLLGNLQAMGTGTDGLQAVAWHVVLAEPDWVNGTNQQAIDRLDRGGQEAQVQGDLIVASGSFCEKVLASALRKGHTVHKALDRRL
jgi:SWI/SNF-related matrix-associated actin-dependent regulator 1 of chromatin subfamily A